MTEFASWLVATRKQKKLTQAQLAERVGVSPAQVSQWESGKAEPKTDVLKQLEKVLGSSPRATKGQAAPAKSSEPPSNGRSSKSNGSNGAPLRQDSCRLNETRPRGRVGRGDERVQ
jgi:transcriptional regulator with XRE-family HTH domain